MAPQLPQGKFDGRDENKDTRTIASYKPVQDHAKPATGGAREYEGEKIVIQSNSSKSQSYLRPTQDTVNELLQVIKDKDNEISKLKDMYKIMEDEIVKLRQQVAKQGSTSNPPSQSNQYGRNEPRSYQQPAEPQMQKNISNSHRSAHNQRLQSEGTNSSSLHPPQQSQQSRHSPKPTTYGTPEL